MTTPTHITHAQWTAAVEALGLDPNIVRTITMDAHTDEVTVTVALPIVYEPVVADASQAVAQRVERSASAVWAIGDVIAERARQDARWGEQNHPDGTGGPGRIHDADEARAECKRQFAEGTGTWLDVLDEEVAEAYAESEPAKLRAELVQVAAVVVAWIEAIDRRTDAAGGAR